MRYIFIAFLIFLSAVYSALAADTNFTHKDRFCVVEKVPTAQSPVGAVVETTGVFVGKITSNIEAAFTGEKKIMVENETGECRVFPFCVVGRVADKTFNAVTLNKLKTGDKVKVDYASEGGIDVAVKVEKIEE